MCNDRYWTAEVDKLVWKENAYFEMHSDYIEFEVIRWHTRQWSLQDVADQLDAESKAVREDGETWYLCCGTVYRDPGYPFRDTEEGQVTKFEAICDVEFLSAKYLSDLSEVPRHAITARGIEYSCLHLCSCVDGHTHNDALAVEVEQMSEDDEDEDDEWDEDDFDEDESDDESDEDDEIGEDDDESDEDEQLQWTYTMRLSFEDDRIRHLDEIENDA
jgi:hypothetical protein